MEDYIKGVKAATGLTGEEVKTQIDANVLGQIEDSSYEAGIKDGENFGFLYGRHF